MKPIEMVDLRGQYRRLQTEIDAAIAGVLHSGQFIQGPEVRALELELRPWAGDADMIGCANGTDALQLALMALDLKPGDEVIVPSFTFVASAEAIALLGLRVVFADVLADSFGLNVESVARCIGPRTRAVVVVHLFGQAAPMEALMALAEAHELFVIEDNAQSFGASISWSDGSVRFTGAIGDVATTSFFPSKNLGAFGDGGMVMSRWPELAARVKKLANHGADRKYYHDEVGVNSRLDAMQAAVLRVKLRHFENSIARRRAAAAFYDAALADLDGVVLPRRMAYSNHMFHQYTLRVGHGRRDALKDFLAERNIPAMVYYPVPLHLQDAYKNARADADLSVSEQLAAEVLSLPMHTELDELQLSRISDAIHAFFNA